MFICKNNPASKGIKHFLIDIDLNSLEFESLVESDYTYPAKILYSVDTRIQEFMSQNKRVEDGEYVSKRLINFSNLTNACLNQSFNVSLTPLFKLLKEKPDDHASNSYRREQELKRKRP